MSRYTRAKLTEKTLGEMKPGDIIMDTETTGLMARCGQRGIGIVLKYSISRRQRIYTIGTLGDGGLTLTKARQAAEVARGQIRGGVDPMAARDAARASETLSDLVPDFEREHIATLRASSARGYRQRIRPSILPTIGRLRVDAISVHDVRKWHRSMGEIPTSANFALRVLSVFMTWAIERGYRSDNPTKGVKPYPSRKIERYLSPDETDRLLKALDELAAEGRESPHFLAGVRLLLLTGARWGEIFGCKWEWVDLQRSQIRFPDDAAKTRGRVIRLSPEAVEVLAALPRFAGNPYVICGERVGRPWIAKSKPWARLLARAGITGFRPHDLRHSWASEAVSAGASLFTVGAHLGHRSPQTTQRYAHLSDDAVRDLSDSVAARIARRQQPVEK